MKNSIWKWFGSEYKAYCQKKEDYDKIITWSGSRHGSVYYFPNGHMEYDVIIPKRLYKRTALRLGLSLKIRENTDVE